MATHIYLLLLRSSHLRAGGLRQKKSQEFEDMYVLIDTMAPDSNVTRAPHSNQHSEMYMRNIARTIQVEQKIVWY